MKDKLQEKKYLYNIIAKKDPEAYGKLYDLYIERIYRFVYYKVRSKEEAEDLVSDIFLKCWNYLISKPSNGITSFSGLIYKIARNVVIDSYRKKAKNNEYPLEAAFMLAEDDCTEKIEIKQDVEYLLSLIAKLKYEYQEVVMLRYVEELSIKEIAKIVNKKQTAVRVTLHRAVKKLKSFS